MIYNTDTKVSFYASFVGKLTDLFKQVGLAHQTNKVRPEGFRGGECL